MTRLIRVLKNILGSRIGQVLFVVHSLLLVYVYASREPFSEREFHFHYEPLLYKVLVTMDLPALVVATLIGMSFVYLRSQPVNSWWSQSIMDAIGFICVSVQWWLVGYCIERIVRRRGHLKINSTI